MRGPRPACDPSRMRPALVASVLFLLGCDGHAADDAGADAWVPDAGPSCTSLEWSPTSGTLSRWPEPALLAEDPTTETGRRLSFVPEDYPVLTTTLRGYR